MSRAFSRPRALSLTAVVGATILALAAAVLVPLGATAAPVALSGLVLKPGGAPAASLKVTAVRTSDAAQVATVTTTSSGAFTFASLPADDYTLKFPKTATSFAQYLGGGSEFAEAQPIELVDAGGNKSFIRTELLPSGTFAGSVKKPNGAALVGYAVRVYDDTALVATATTNTSGKYSITGLEPGDYLLQATTTSSAPSSAASWSGGASSRGDADPLLVQAKRTTTYNFVLGAAAKISGIVTGDSGAPTAEPLADVLVTPLRILESGDFEELPAFARKTGSTGSYTLVGLPVGQYTLRFDPPTSAPYSPSGTHYGHRYLGNSRVAEFGTVRSLESGQQLTGQNIVLPAAHTVAGVVTADDSPTNPPIENLLVTAVPIVSGNTLDGRVFRTHTGVDGSYELTGLSPGDYRVTVGSLEDSLDDGVTEDTSWSVAVEDVFISALFNPAPIVDFSLAPRQEVALVIPPAISTPAGVNVADAVYASTGDWTHAPGSVLTFTYQWFRSGMQIDGATQSTYELAPGDYQSPVTVRVTAHDPAWGSATAESSPITVEIGPMIVQSGEIVTEGEVAVGKSLSLEFGPWSSFGRGLDPVLDIRWLAGSSVVTATEVGTGPTHTVTAADRDLGPKLYWRVTASRWGYTDSVPFTSNDLAILDGSFVATTAPKVTKSTTKFTATTGAWTPTPTSVAVTWTVHEKDGSSTITNGTTLPRSSAQAGRYISVAITPLGSHMTEDSLVLTAQTGSAFTATGSSAPVGTPRVGTALSAPAWTWLPAPTATTYKWQYLSGATWKSISGATSSTFTPSASYLNKKVRVIVGVSTTGYPKATKTSSAVKIGAGAAAAVTGAPPSYEAPWVNGTTTITVGEWSPTPTSYSYQWKVSSTETGPFTAISGATKASYMPPPSMLGKYLRPELTAKRTGHASATVALPTELVLPGVTKPTAAPTVTRAANVFTASLAPTKWSPQADLVEYEWEYWSGGSSFFATGPTFDASAYPDAPIWLTVKGPKSGWATGESTSLVRKGVMRPGDPNQIFQWGSGYYVDTQLEASIDNSLHPMQSFITSQKIQWQYEKSPGVWANISGATGTTFTPTGATYADKKVRFLVTRTADNFEPFTEVSEIQLVQKAPAPQFSVIAAYDSTPAVADTVGIEPLDWDMPVSLAYSWQLAPSATGPWTPIAGATGPAYTVPVSSHGQYLRLVLTATRPGHWPKIHTFNAVQLNDGYLDNVTPPKVTKTGDVLSVSLGTWDAPGATATGWSWVEHLPNGSTQVIHTGSSLTLLPEDAGHKITVTLTASAPHTEPGDVTVLAQRGAAPTLGDHAQMADAHVGTEVWFLLEWNYPGVSETFQWYRNGVAIPSATSAGYLITDADLGKKITVKASAAKDGFATAVVTLSAGTATTTLKAVNTAKPAISRSGAAGSNSHVGETLVASPGSWDLDGVIVQYQWYSSAGPIDGATSSTYITRVSDLGSEVWVETVATKPFHGDSLPATSYRLLVGWGTAPQLVTPADFGNTGIKATGSSTIVLSLTAPIVWNIAGTTTTYQWERMHVGDSDFGAIAGATSSSYTLGAGDAPGDQYRLKVDVWAPGHPAGQKTSNILTPIS